jgi:membrane associated rhomboid family serine protease
LRPLGLIANSPAVVNNEKEVFYQPQQPNGNIPEPPSWPNKEVKNSHFSLPRPLNLHHTSPSIENMNTYFFGGPATRTVKGLIIANVAVFLLQIIFHMLGSNFIELYLGLVPARVTHDLMLWQLATYMFLHGGVFHILVNMLILFMFGNQLERYWGTRRLLKYYFITGIGAGICSWLITPNSWAVVIGASGAIYGLLLAYGLIYPNRIVYLNFLLPLKVKWLVIIMGAVAFLNSISGSEPGVASIAHLSGMVVGYLYLKGKDWWDKYKYFDEQRRRDHLKRQFEVYYGDVRRKIDTDKKKGPTIH